MIVDDPSDRAAGSIAVLLVEDNAGDARLVREALGDDPESFILAHAPRLSTALDLLEREKFDIVLLDLQLPDSDGLEGFEWIRRSHPQVPVLVLTGNRDRETGLEAVRRGAQDFLLKGESDVPRAVRYATERMKLQARLEDAERMGMLGRLASSFAHDFNNVLMGIQPFVAVLQHLTPDDPKAASALEHIRASLRRGKAITSEVLRFTRPAALRMETFEPCRWLDSLRKDLRLLAPQKINLEMHCDPSLGEVRSDPGQLAFALEVFVRNACDAVLPAGKVTVRLLAGQKGTWVIAVSDSGAGIPEEHLSHIFEPMYSTRPKGSGLGLAIARQIADSLGGRVAARNCSEGGAEVRLEIPVDPAPDAS